MTRSIYIPICLLIAGLLSAITSGRTATQPNIIFILADDLGYGDLGVFWQNKRKEMGKRAEPWHATPHLDRLAADGIILPHHYSAAPVCAPSRASLMSGLHQGHANVRDNHFDKALEENHNIATVLKAAGYTTACIGKWGLAGDAPAFPAHPLDRGFDDFFGILRHIDGHDHYPKEGPHRGPKQVWENRKEISANLDRCYTTDLYTARAKHWIARQRESANKKPFFLYLAYDTPHAVLDLPTQDYPAGMGMKGGLQWIGEPGEMINTAGGNIDSWIHPEYQNATWDHDHNPTTPETGWPDVYKRYATSVRRIDDCVGDLLQQLKDLDIDRNTLVVFTSDNGPSTESYLKEPYSPAFFESYGPFSGIKRDLREGGIRVGAIARWPAAIPAGASSDLPCGQWDWLATFAEAAGLPAPARTDGRSLIPTLIAKGVQRVPTIYMEYHVAGTTPAYLDFPHSARGNHRGQMQMIRNQQFTGLRFNMKNSLDDFKVFDVVNDPRQAVTISDPESSARMKGEVLRMRRRLADAPRPYDEVLIPPVNLESPIEGVLNHLIYQGKWPWIPDFGSLTPNAEGSSGRLTAKDMERAGPHGLRTHGYFRAPTDGEYTFYIKSEERAQLRLHQSLVIDHDFHHQTSWVSASIRLKTGFHPFCLDSCHASGGEASIQLECSGPNLPRQTITNPKLCATSKP